MNSNHKSEEDEIWEGLYPRIASLVKQNKWTWEFFGVVFGFGGALFLIILGFELDIIAWLLAPNEITLPLKKISLVVFLLVLPMMIGGSHSLDLLERNSLDF
jgi:hypothetical protein